MTMIDKTKPYAGVINNWRRWEFDDGEYVVLGNLERDVRERYGFEDGCQIRTSLVIQEDGNYIETRNSIYTLGSKAKEVDHGSIKVYN